MDCSLAVERMLLDNQTCIRPSWLKFIRKRDRREMILFSYNGNKSLGRYVRGW